MAEAEFEIMLPEALKDTYAARYGVSARKILQFHSSTENRPTRPTTVSTVPPSPATIEKRYRCTGCQKKFSHPSNLSRHRKGCMWIYRQSVAHAPRVGTHKCGKCDHGFFKMIDLCEHLQKSHSIPADIQDLQFQDYESFESWKKQLEKPGQVRFTQEGTSSSKSAKICYYYCNRSGSYTSRSKGLRAAKVPRTIKRGFRCSAFITASIDSSTGVVSVTCCLNHYGHDLLTKSGANQGSSIATFRQRNMHRRHQLALKMTSPEIAQVQPGVWRVASQNEPSGPYFVQMVKTSCDCNFRCNYPKCRVCPHMYACTCSDAKLKYACKHVHLVRITAATQQEEPDNEPAVAAAVLEEFFQDDDDYETAPDPDLEKRLEMQALCQHMMKMVDKIPRNRLDEVLKRMKALDRFMSRSAQEQEKTVEHQVEQFEHGYYQRMQGGNE